MAYVELSFLGFFGVKIDGIPIHGFATDKVRALLAYLVIEADMPHSRDQLIGIFWPERPTEAAKASLRSALTNLRHALGENTDESPLFEITRETVRFTCPPSCWVDVAAFEQQIAEADYALNHSGDIQLAVNNLQSAVTLYFGDFLAGFALKDCPEFDNWEYFVRERLRRKATMALGLLAEHYESRCEYEQAIGYARKHLTIEPWQEQAHQQLMRLLALNGQRTEALEQYSICCEWLRNELDVTPSEETFRLYEQIRDGILTPLPEEKSHFHKLPVYLTPLVGRQRELVELADRLADPNCRLLTLVGPGGSGKTRLAVETASQHAGKFKDGACFVPLVTTERVETIPSAINRALNNVGFSIDIRQSLLDYLSKREILLVLDNYEQLLLEGTEVLVDILDQVPQVKLLVTSRERLHLPAEWLYPVEGLSLPPSTQNPNVRSFEAIQLFSISTQRQRGYELSDDELPEVVHICRSVSGMPLAIEIATSWTRLLSCEEIASEIDHSLDFLQSDRRELQSRHRNIQAVFEYTWKMLTEEEQTVFRKLSVFRGGFTYQATEQIAGASLRTLTALVDKSLVSRLPGGRYALHELLRQFGAEKLDRDHQEKTQTCDSHCHYFLDFVSKTDCEGPDVAAHIAKIDPDLDNIQAAWRWATATSKMDALNLALRPIANYYAVKARWVEELNWITQTLAELPTNYPESLEAKLLFIKGGNLTSLRKDEEAREALDKSLEISRRLGNWEDLANALNAKAELFFQDDYLIGINYYEESIAFYPQTGRFVILGAFYWRMGTLYYYKGFLTKSESCFQKSVEILDTENPGRFMIHALEKFGRVKLIRGELEAAQDLLQKCQTLLDECKFGLPVQEAYVLCDLALLSWRRGRMEEARRQFEESIAICQKEVDQGIVIIWSLQAHFRIQYCHVLEESGDFKYMQQQAQLAVQTHREIPPIIYHGDAPGQAQACLSRAEMHLGDFASARQHLQQALQIWLGEHLSDWALFGLYYWANLLVKEADSLERKRLALELLSFVLDHPRLEGIDYHPAIFGEPALSKIRRAIAQLEAELPDEAVMKAREYGQRLELKEVVQEICAGTGRYWADCKY